jgi:dTDP-L-rhamnose 4-epimerase
MNSTDMIGERIFVTGGAGFIGSRLVRALAARGADIVVYDNLLPQVHGPSPKIELPARIILGDVRDRAALEAAVRDHLPTTIVHLAAETGTGQSADEPSRYADVNVGGTAHLIEIARRVATPPKRFVLAATRAVYGEGAYLSASGGVFAPPPRQTQDMAAGRFGLFDRQGSVLTPAPTPEDLPPAPGSVYGSTKLMQEYLLQQTPAPWRSVILRLQNVYGPGQSLRNPYTGVLSIFCQQAIAGQTLNIYEDGAIDRDFVFVDDVVKAFVAACHSQTALDHIINIGSGQRTSIDYAAQLILDNLGLPRDQRRVSGAFRPGDIRHAVADISRAKQVLAWTPSISVEAGVAALVEWAREEASNLKRPEPVGTM